MCIMFFIGKGGVGKIILVVVIVLWVVQFGIRIFIFFIDFVYSFFDVFDQEFIFEFQEIVFNFFVQEVDVYYFMKKYWENVW